MINHMMHFFQQKKKKRKLRVDLDIQNFENQCFSVNDLLIKSNESKDKLTNSLFN